MPLLVARSMMARIGKTVAVLKKPWAKSDGELTFGCLLFLK